LLKLLPLDRLLPRADVLEEANPDFPSAVFAAFAIGGRSLPVAAVASLALADSLPSPLGLEVVAPLAALAFAAFGTDVLQRSAAGWLRKTCAFFVCLALALGFVMSVAASPTPLPTLVALFAGALLTSVGIWTGSRAAGVSGVVIIIAAMSLGLDSLIDLIVSSNWIALAATGASIIVLGSALERHGALLRHHTVRWLVRRDALE